MTFTPRAASMSPIIGTLLVIVMTGTWLLFTRAPLRSLTLTNASADDNCQLIELSPPTDAASLARPDRGSLHQTALTRRFRAGSTQCWDVQVHGFAGASVVLAVTAAGHVAEHQLAQLTAALADDSERPDPAVILQPLADDIPRATWYYVVHTGQRTRIVLANTAAETVPQLSVTFTALQSMAWMETGTGAPSADVDGLLLLELDTVGGLVSPSPQYMKLVDHCFVSVNAYNNRNTGGGFTVLLTHQGRIGPGVYEIAGADRAYIMPAENAPGRVTGQFGIGEAHAHAGGLAQSFWFRSGVLEITSISDRLVQGVVRANGWRRPVTSWDRGPEGLAELSTVITFAVVANDRGELLASEKRINERSSAGIWRRWAHECLQQPTPPFSTADDPDEAEPDLDSRSAPDDPAPDDPGPVREMDPPADPAIPSSIFCWKDCVPAMFCWKDCVPDDARRGDPGGDPTPANAVGRLMPEFGPAGALATAAAARAAVRSVRRGARAQTRQAQPRQSTVPARQ